MLHYRNILGSRTKRSSTAKVIAVIATTLSVAVVVISNIVSSGFRDVIKDKAVDLLDFAHVTQQSLFVLSGNTTNLDSVQIRGFNKMIAPQRLVGVVQTEGVLQSGTLFLPTLLVAREDYEVQTKEILLSTSAAKQLKVKAGDKISVISLADNVPMSYPMRVGDLYSTGLTDIEVAIARVSLDEARRIAQSTEFSYYAVPQAVDMDEIVQYAQGDAMRVDGVESRATQIFGWLDMIDNNLSLVLIIMLSVALVNVMSSTLIIMLDNTRCVAILRALGMSRMGIAKVFVIGIGKYSLIGVLLGLIISIGFGLLQSNFSLITLDEASYFVSSVPIHFEWARIGFYVMLMFGVIALSLVIPIRIVGRMAITKSLKFK